MISSFSLWLLDKKEEEAIDRYFGSQQIHLITIIKYLTSISGKRSDNHEWTYYLSKVENIFLWVCT